MTQIVSLTDLPEDARGGAVSVGNFDGVHRGHASLLAQTRKLADQVGGPAVAVVLDPHPVAVLRPEATPQRLSTIALRAQRMASIGIDFLAVCDVDREFLGQTASDFFANLIVDRLNARGMIEGPNFYFGAGRSGDVTVLAQLCEAAGIQFRVASETISDDQMVSSSRIRQAIEAGQIQQARSMLGWDHVIEGVVVTGEKRGRQLGFPTANLDSIEVLLPADGVYCGVAQHSHSTDNALQKTYPAAIHIGPNPTFDERTSRKVEVHLIGFEGDLYGKRLRINLQQHIRPTEKFSSAEALVAQLRDDIAFARQHAAL